MSIGQTVERFIIEELILDNRPQKIEHDSPLFVQGILDSLSLLRLILYLEQQFGVTVEDGEVIPENFESINRIAEFLNRKMKK